MSKEYKQIPQAPLYEIDAEGNVRKIKKEVPILPFPLGSREVKLNINDTTRQPFNVDELVSELFGESGAEKPKTGKKIKLESGQEVTEGSGNVITTKPVGEIRTDGITEEILEERASERATDTAQMPSSGKITTPHLKVQPTEVKETKIAKEKPKKEKKAKEERKVSNDNPIIAKIMKLKCYESVKMWKLHQNGVNNADITILVNDPHDFVVVKTLEKYKKNKTLQERADKVKL